MGPPGIRASSNADWPAPFCGMLLADMGAEVVRIDRSGQSASAALLTRQGHPQLRPAGHRARPQAPGWPRHRARSDGPGRGADRGFPPRRDGAPRPARTGGFAWRATASGIRRMTGWGQSGPLAHSAGHDINYPALRRARCHRPPRFRSGAAAAQPGGGLGGGAMLPGGGRAPLR